VVVGRVAARGCAAAVRSAGLDDARGVGRGDARAAVVVDSSGVCRDEASAGDGAL